MFLIHGHDKNTFTDMLIDSYLCISKSHPKAALTRSIFFINSIKVKVSDTFLIVQWDIDESKSIGVNILTDLF